MRVDKIDVVKDNSPALLFQGMSSIVKFINWWLICDFLNSKEKLQMVMLSVQMMVGEWILKVCANA